MAGGLRASGPKADIALIVADNAAVIGGAFTTNVMCAAPVIYCKEILAKRDNVRAVRVQLKPIHPVFLSYHGMPLQAEQTEAVGLISPANQIL